MVSATLQGPVWLSESGGLGGGRGKVNPPPRDQRIEDGDWGGGLSTRPEAQCLGGFWPPATLGEPQNVEKPIRAKL